MTEQEEVKRAYQVEIEVLERRVFFVDEANSQEEAESTAEEWFNDGEEGALIEQDITNVDSYPTSKEDLN